MTIFDNDLNTSDASVLTNTYKNGGNYEKIAPIDASDAKLVDSNLLKKKATDLFANIESLSTKYSENLTQFMDVVASTETSVSLADLLEISTEAMNNYSIELNEKVMKAMNVTESWAANKIEYAKVVEEYNLLVEQKKELDARIDALKTSEPPKTIEQTFYDKGAGEERTEWVPNPDYDKWVVETKEFDQLHELISRIEASIAKVENAKMENKRLEEELSACNDEIDNLSVFA